jgi:hypothetical protein
MPWYRTDDGQGVMHLCIRGRQGSPLPCRARRFETDNPAHGDVCGRVGGKLCDAPVGENLLGKPLTCDMPLCPKHATSGGTNIDYCPRHKHLAPGSAPREETQP